MPNKYNIRAKRLSLDNLIRERAWSSFQNSFSQLHVVDNDSRGSDSERVDVKQRQQQQGGVKNLCNAIIQCRNHQTTHRTLLHSLCDIPSDSSPPPSELIYRVACASPRSLLLHESGNERTPLHLAIHQGASLSTITALLDAVDKDDSVNRKDVLMALDSKLQTPLLAAVKRGIDDDIVKYLVDQDEDGSSLLLSGNKKSKKKQQQLSLSQTYTNLPLKYVASRESFFVGEGLDSPQDLLRFMIVRTYRAKMKRRFPTFYNTPTENASRNKESNNNQTETTIDIDDDTCLLQATIFCHELIGSSKVASSILSYIIRNNLYHRERFDTRQDVAGNLTLHIACLSETPTFDQILRLGDRESDYGLNSEDCTLMEYLIKATPPPQYCTSPYLTKNWEGETPLHCAIKSGKEWSQIQLLIKACPISLQTFTLKGELPLHLAIKFGRPISSYIMKLWDYYPESASMVDRSTGLYPFQLVTLYWAKQQQQPRKRSKSRKKPKGTMDGTKEQPVEDVWDETSLSFFMLRECPSILSSSLLCT